MSIEWRQIQRFPGYSVSDTGQVRNDETERVLATQVNQQGVVHVGLYYNGIQYKRSLSIIVAEAFLLRPSFEFNTPVNLDGNKGNNHAVNLVWRPRWFALRYTNQFLQSGPSINRPVEIIETKEVFENSWQAATTLGLLDREIAISIMTCVYVFPTYQHFRVVE